MYQFITSSEVTPSSLPSDEIYNVPQANDTPFAYIFFLIAVACPTT